MILSGKIKLLITNEILTEYEEVISRKTNESIANNIISFLTRSPDVEFIQPFFKWDLIHQDSDDNKFVDCALNGDADFLVTDDKHFNVLKSNGFPPIKVLKTSQLLEYLLNNGSA